ncbi:ABC transporter substrate-binding protein [Sedimentibacter sp. zth1]|uniref:ABC transporter substrate-binding protein n=1 Tax=Sedimentibacter sp. zth1 TaxID=2816908 RepID=UPI001A911972|nr:ABC transporter substrate-binding protein [Sedimentibacter sp. zth1]QSX06112.1 ABC transporter substrate-binding protein [Sedimentibacter sp. zth1]
MKKFLAIFLTVIMVLILACGCDKQNNRMTQNVRLVEVTHSVFYAPQYVAIEKGFFTDNEIEIELINGGGADKCMTALLSDQADVAFMGPEASVYVYKQDKEDYVVNFAQLTQRDGSFIVGREKNDDFKIEDMKGKTILGGRKGGMPLMTLEYVLKQHGLTPNVDLTVRTDIQFDMMAGAFASGEADYTTLFEPLASNFEAEQKGYIVGSLGAEAGYIPYTCYCTLLSSIEGKEELIQNFTNAIYKGMIWVQNNSAEEVAEAILPQFPDSNIELLTQVVQRYKDQDTWKPDLILGKDGYDRMIDIIITAGELEEGAPYDKVFVDKFAKEAMKNTK